MNPIKSEVKRVNKHYYEIVARPLCTVFVDEKLMKKVNKVLYRYSQEIKELLENNTDSLIKHDWALAYPNKKQTAFYSSKKIDEYTTLVPPFTTRLVKNIYDIGNQSIYSDEVEAEVEKDLMLLAKEENL